MNHPSDLLNRAMRRRRPAAPASPAPRVPAPAPIPASEPPQAAPQAPSQPPSQPQTAGGHTLYRALMRSHDRMGTRHLPDAPTRGK